jgi:hypothetical protein
VPRMKHIITSVLYWSQLHYHKAILLTADSDIRVLTVTVSVAVSAMHHRRGRQSCWCSSPLLTNLVLREACDGDKLIRRSGNGRIPRTVVHTRKKTFVILNPLKY